MSGDVLLRETLWAQAARDADARGERDYDFRPMLAGVRARISAADLAICHLETPVGEPSGPFSDYPVFKVPPQIIPALAWAGYDACTTASNHTLDAGADGVDRTLAALDAAGIAHAGSARTSREDDRTTILTVHPQGPAGSPGRAAVKVALLSYTYGLNGFPMPAGKSWIVDTIDPEQILSEARQARRAGAEVVLVALHWGQEYRNEPTKDQQRIARRLLASPDIDLVYGHHAHVPQPFGKINGKWIVYGLGNHLAEQVSQPERTHEGTMARFTFAERGGRWIVTAAEYIPTAIGLQAPFRLADLPRQLSRDDLTGAERAAARRSYDEVSDIVDSLGASKAGLRPG
jgi:poly-gamma-glutamate capsule biosynthesis protein CapA/YwtB (metallophosphatase superfamily)